MNRYILLFILQIILIFITMILCSIYLLYTVTEGNNDCMVDYVEYLKEGGSDGYFYKNGDIYHIDSVYLPEYGEVIGKAKGCLIIPKKHVYLAMFNTVYCSTVYILK